MPRTYLRRAVLLSTPVAVLLALSIAWSAPHLSAGDDARKLLDERRNVLQQIVQLEREAYRRAGTRFESVYLAEKELLEAELELAERPAQKIEVYEQLIKTMQEMEVVSHRLYEAGEAAPADHLRSKAARLKAQAELIRERDRSSR